MANKRDTLKRLWAESFGDSAEYIDMYFDRVYNDSDALTLEIDGKTVSSLLLQRYVMKFHGQEVPTSYIAGASTRKQERGKGYMSALIIDSLIESRRRGDMFCALIPAQPHLYFFYDRFGFATTVYYDYQRYTSVHHFPYDGSYTDVDNHFSPDIYEAFHNFEMQQECGIIHSQRNFLNILDDLTLDHGKFIALSHASDGSVAGMGFAFESDGYISVRCLLHADKNARSAVLERIRYAWPDSPICVMANPDKQPCNLHARGMFRIIDAGECLRTIAAANPQWKCAIKVTDPILTDNNHIYIIANGRSDTNDSYRGKLDFDVNADILTRLIFSSQSIGEITSFPSCRPTLRLMLD